MSSWDAIVCDGETSWDAIVRDGDALLVDVQHWLGGFLARAARPRPSRRHAMRVGDGCEGDRRHARARRARDILPDGSGRSYTRDS